QSGYFPGTARASLQKYYGDAGRGLVFPLRLAGTNQPDDYRISSTGGFSRLNNERGLCGYALNTSKGATLAIKTNPFFVSDNSFNKLSLLSSAPGVKPLLKVKDEQLQPKEISLGEYQYSEASWETAVSNIELSLQGDGSHLYGMMLEKQQPGLLFHATGINGAGFYNLIGASQLFTQISLLNPDLIVISLGTNDAQGNFKEKVFSANLEKFMAEFRGANPTTPVLFTLPPDSHKRGKHNQDLGKVEKIIIDYAKNNNCAWWDLSAVMGGKGSVIKWRKEQMASKDLLHYTPKGYMLQGYLFYQALIKSYKAFSEK
ncbi:MAG: GDSL-type esterase/lipase family protein, partial [Candidatus Cloacimonetes bacterium]|nr:GDSL-type esterase/lipase family protein [Candidatus Cloacimonadota bacterium]